MGDADEDRMHAQQYPEGDVLRILYEQHARIRDLFAEIKSSTGEERKQAFGELRALIVAHETAEEMVLRPVTSDAGGKAVADARNTEESEATDVLKQLDGMDADSAEFAGLHRSRAPGGRRADRAGPAGRAAGHAGARPRRARRVPVGAPRA